MWLQPPHRPLLRRPRPLGLADSTPGISSRLFQRPFLCPRERPRHGQTCQFIKKHPSLSPTMMCKPKSMRGRKLHRFEVGANAFAGAVLLPELLVRKRYEVSPVSLAVPRQLKKEFDVSILTAAIRFCELSPERCCAVFSKNGVIEWVAPSTTWTRRIVEALEHIRTFEDSAERGIGAAGLYLLTSESLREHLWTTIRCLTASSVRTNMRDACLPQEFRW